MSHGGAVVVEWPRSCDYWRLGRVKKLQQDCSMKCSDFDGCRYGMMSIRKGCEGIAIRKPLRIRSSEPSFLRTFSVFCDESHQHAPCEGVDTENTGKYSTIMATCIHDAWYVVAERGKPQAFEARVGAACIPRCPAHLIPEEDHQIHADDAEGSRTSSRSCTSTNGYKPAGTGSVVPCRSHRSIG